MNHTVEIVENTWWRTWWSAADPVVIEGPDASLIQMGFIYAMILVESLWVPYIGILMRRNSENVSNLSRFVVLFYYLVYVLGSHLVNLILWYTFILRIYNANNVALYIFIHEPYWIWLFFYRSF